MGLVIVLDNLTPCLDWRAIHTEQDVAALDTRGGASAARRKLDGGDTLCAQIPEDTVVDFVPTRA